MTHHEQHTAIEAAFEALTEDGFEGMATAMQILFNEAMKIERSQFLKAKPHERTADRAGYANGFKPKSVESRVGELALRIPQVRGTDTPFYPRSLERGLRSERALTLAIAEMYVQGVSTRRVQAVAERLCGTDVTSVQVSRAAKLLDEELTAWRTRKLGEIKHLILDARYEKVRSGGSVVDCAVLIAKGVRAEDGRRMILGVSVSLSEAEPHWRTFLESLQDRGMHGVRTVTSDDHKGLRAALKTRLTGVPWFRCQFHLQRNAAAYVTRKEDRGRVAADIRAIFNAPSRRAADELLRQTADAWRERAPRLADWMEANLPDGLTVLDEKLGLSESARRSLRTTPRLVRWVARTRDLEGTVRAARSAGFDLGPVAAGSRTRPDGSLVSWRFTDPYADPAGAVVPFLLDWGATPNPA